MKLKFLCFFLFLITFDNPLLSQTFGFEFKEDKKRVIIDAEIYNNLVVIPVLLNGKVPLKFILDTGIRTAILTDKIITDILQVSYDRKITVKGPGDGRVVEAYVANNISLELPGVGGRGQALLVLEEDYLQLSNNLGTEVHGIIGYELFSRFVVQIDYKASQVILHKKAFFNPKRKFTPIPIMLEDTKPYINADVLFKNGYAIHGKFLIDTGASHAILLEREENSNRIPTPQQYVRASLGRGLGGVIRGLIARIYYVKINDFKFEDVTASFPDDDSYLDSLFIDRDGTIGGELLKRFRVVMDYSSETIYLKPNNRFNNDFEYNLSGMEVIAAEGNYHKFVVDAVLDNSPAQKAGIKKGDIIEVINGQLAENIKLNYVNIALNSKKGKKVRLMIRRGNELMRKKIELDRNI
jgi:hypothetical protein